MGQKVYVKKCPKSSKKIDLFVHNLSFYALLGPGKES
jgi:hypothetical protein